MGPSGSAGSAPFVAANAQEMSAPDGDFAGGGGAAGGAGAGAWAARVNTKGTATSSAQSIFFMRQPPQTAFTYRSKIIPQPRGQRVDNPGMARNPLSNLIVIVVTLASMPWTPASAQRPSDPALMVPQTAPALDYVAVPDPLPLPP